MSSRKTTVTPLAQARPRPAPAAARPTPCMEVLGFTPGAPRKLPLYLAAVAAGFPSPADDFIDRGLDLNEHLVAHPAATFFVRVHGDSMQGAHVRSGDILVVDRALEPADGKVVVAALDGELTVKRIRAKAGRLFLAPENPDFPAIEVGPEASLEIWGVVTYVIHKL